MKFRASSLGLLLAALAASSAFAQDTTLRRTLGSVVDTAPVASLPYLATDSLLIVRGGEIQQAPGTALVGSTGDGMTVDAANALLPTARTNLGASVAGGIWPAELGGTGVDNTGRTITLSGSLVLGGPLTTTGAGAVTFALPLTTTTYTFPGATSTLASIAGTEVLTNKTINCANNTCTVRIANDVSGLGTGVATFLATPSSANLASAITDETGSGAAVFATSPTLVTPTLGTPASGVLTNTTGLPISTGVSGLGTGVATFLGTPSSANLASALTDETGSGAAVFATSPVLVTPALGTPASGVLTNATGLPISTGVSGLGAGVATFLATPSSANLITAVTDETGSGALVFATSPTLVTPALGTPASGVLTNATGLPVSTGISGLGANVATFLGTPSSANLIAAVSDETGTGALVFANSPTLVTPALGTPASGVLTNATGLPIGTGVSGLGANVATFLATPSSANLAAAVSDETGSGLVVFSTNPIFVDGIKITSATNNSIQMGRVDGTSSTPFMDWNSGATVVDYDVRFLASGGTGVSGGGLLTIIGNLQLNGLISFFGVTASFPALERSATILRAKLADLSAYAPFEADTLRTATAYTVGTLPAGSAGMRAYVTDQLTTCAGVGVALTGGGAVTCPTFYNGTAWVGG